TRMTASASAPRCSALPCPYWCATSAGLTATPTVKKVRRAAIRSVPECAASEIRPRLCEASPAASLSTMSTTAATTEASAVLRWGFKRQVKQNGPPKRPVSVFHGTAWLRVGDIADELLGDAVRPLVLPVMEHERGIRRCVLEVELAAGEPLRTRE